MRRCWQAWKEYLSLCNGGKLPETEEEAIVALFFPVGSVPSCQATSFVHHGRALPSPRREDCTPPGRDAHGV